MQSRIFSVVGGVPPPQFIVQNKVSQVLHSMLHTQYSVLRTFITVIT